MTLLQKALSIMAPGSVFWCFLDLDDSVIVPRATKELRRVFPAASDTDIHVAVAMAAGLTFGPDSKAFHVAFAALA